MRPSLLHVVGARPNFMKVAPVLSAGDAAGLRQVMVHTGQHYDAALSDRIFEDLGLPAPDEHLGVGSGTHAEQTARVMVAIEPVLDRHRPDWVVVYGDVNSTIAAALVAVKKGIRVAHVEAGLRSGDRRMPEEINRILTDQLADLLFTPSRDGDEHLRREGIPDERIVFAGNVMVDTLLRLRDDDRARRRLATLDLAGRPYAFVTLHRPSNVDDRETLAELVGALNDLSRSLTVVFAAHPRTRQRLTEFGLADALNGVRLIDPLSYLEAIDLLGQATLVLTDSGGLQEETTVLGVPCLTARPNTERPVTITEGTNRLVAPNRSMIAEAVADVLAGQEAGRYAGRRPEGWDGRAGQRIIQKLASD